MILSFINIRKVPREMLKPRVGGNEKLCSLCTRGDTVSTPYLFIFKWSFIQRKGELAHLSRFTIAQSDQRFRCPHEESLGP